MSLVLDPIVLAALAAANVLALALWAAARVRVVVQERPVPALPREARELPGEALLAASIARWRGGRAAPAADLGGWIREAEQAERQIRSGESRS
jgi:hypothetical protein